MKTLAIIGSGELGQQMAYYISTEKKYSKIVFFDDFSIENEINGMKILGKTNEIEENYKEKKFDELLIGIGYKHLEARKTMFEKFSKFIPFGTFIHSTCWIDPTAIIEMGCFIYPGCIIDKKVIIRANTTINISTTISHDSVIESHCFLSPRIAIAGFVKIHELCFIGINTTIIDNLTIAKNTFVGAGSVVIKSIEKKGLYVGNPAKFIR